MLSTAPSFVAKITSAAQPLTTAVLRDLVQIEQIQHEWQGLFVRCNALSLFQLPAWHTAWWRAFKGETVAHIVTVRDENNRLIGIAPLQLRKDVWRGLPVRVLGSYNNEHASRCDFLIDPSYRQQVIAAIVQQLSQSKWNWDVLHLRQIPQQVAWLDDFLQVCQGAGLRPFAPTAGIEKCAIALDGTWQNFLASKTRHFRTRLKENMRRVEKSGHIKYRRSADIAADFELFKQLEHTSWKAQDSHARLGDQGWDFQREIALSTDAGVRCQNLFLEIDGRVVGAIHSLGLGSRMYAMQVLFDESVRHLYPGRAMFTEHIADMFADAQTQVLDLNGNSAFCQSWTEHAEQFIDLQVFNNNPYSWLLSMFKKSWGRNR